MARDAYATQLSIYLKDLGIDYPDLSVTSSDGRMLVNIGLSVPEGTDAREATALICDQLEDCYYLRRILHQARRDRDVMEALARVLEMIK